MLNTNREFYVIFQNRAGDKIKPQMRESPPRKSGELACLLTTDNTLFRLKAGIEKPTKNTLNESQELLQQEKIPDGAARGET